jgi:hypothetical protein
MLDKSLIGTPGKPESLKCEMCGLMADYEENFQEWESIDDTGCCTECPLN